MRIYSNPDGIWNSFLKYKNLQFENLEDLSVNYHSKFAWILDFLQFKGNICPFFNNLIKKITNENEKVSDFWWKVPFDCGKKYQYPQEVWRPTLEEIRCAVGPEWVLLVQTLDLVEDPHLRLHHRIAPTTTVTHYNKVQLQHRSKSS